MSSFLFLWHRVGGPVPPEHIALAEAHRVVGRTAPPRRRLGPSVGAWHWEGEWAPGAESELPCADAGWLVTGTLRLDDRGTLAARLRDRGFESPVARDTLLAVSSLKAWGDAAPARWIGDYAVAALAPAEDRLIVARGITGVRSCFLLSAGPLVGVSDDLALLVRIAGGRATPPEPAIAEYLRHGTLVSPGLTFHRGITRVPTAHTVVITRDGREHLTRHWEFPAPAVRHGRRDEEVVEEFRAAVGAAVADRLRGPCASILLSGGLDSPALAVEATRVAPSVRLSALTASWERLLDDPEPALATAVAKRLGIVHAVHAFDADEGLPGGEPFVTPEPVPDVEPWLWRAQATRLSRHAPVVLNGEDVDALLTPPTLIGQLMQDGAGRTLSAWRAYRAATGTRPWIGMREHVRETFGLTREQAPPTWLRAEVRARVAGRRGPAGSHPTRARAVRQLQQSTWDATCWLDDPVMSGSDVIVLLPFMDPRVITCCFALPAVPWLQRKHLLRRAYRDALPSEVIERPKSPVRGYYDARVRRWRALGAHAPLPVAMDTWVDMKRWRSVLATSAVADEVWAAWRVLELSRWLAQDGA